MFRRLRPRSAYDVIAVLALFVAVGTSGAYAANTVFSTDIVDGEVKNADIGGNQVTTTKIKNGNVMPLDIAADAVTGPKVLDDSLNGDDVQESTLGLVPDADMLDGRDSKSFARLGGVVNGDGSVVQGSGFTVTHPNDGEYQVSFPAGTLSNAGCPPVVTAMVFAGVVRHPQVTGRTCNGLGAGSFTVKTLASDGESFDTPFLFIAM